MFRIEIDVVINQNWFDLVERKIVSEIVFTSSTKKNIIIEITIQK